MLIGIYEDTSTFCCTEKDFFYFNGQKLLLEIYQAGRKQEKIDNAFIIVQYL